ncbi:transposase [Kribbella qitaiheensis]|uniref:transposase n=1 Tax=Kribbella qitaiheensis TaxID=1544730 RepID=UPI0019D57A74|nr:transposase [Kribbella qitaiheensis]
MIAKYLRLRQHRLRTAAPYSGETKAVRTVVRTRDDLVEMRVAAVNQLAAHLGEKRLAAFCRARGYSGKRPAAGLLQRLRSAPAGTTDPALTTALRDAVLALVNVVKAVNAAVKDLGRSVTARLEENPDGGIFTSLPRSGQINAAQILAEWSDCRQAYKDPDSIAALAGCTPVTKASGKHQAVHFRWVCNKRFAKPSPCSPTAGATPAPGPHALQPHQPRRRSNAQPADSLSTCCLRLTQGVS